MFNIVLELNNVAYFLMGNKTIDMWNWTTDKEYAFSFLSFNDAQNMILHFEEGGDTNTENYQIKEIENG